MIAIQYTCIHFIAIFARNAAIKKIVLITLFYKPFRTKKEQIFTWKPRKYQLNICGYCEEFRIVKQPIESESFNIFDCNQIKIQFSVRDYMH
jgi:hypothetical protein